MTCESPFVFVLAEASVEYPYTFSCEGSTSVPGYDIPSVPLCLIYPVTQCSWGGWDNTVLNCQTNWSSCCCWNTPAIPIWPSFTVSGGANIPMMFEVADSVEISAEAPLTPVETASITIYSFDFNFGINGYNYQLNISLGEDGITTSEANGSVSLTIPIGSFTESTTIDGVTYSIDFTCSVLFCLTPDPPVGWVNLQSYVGFGVEVDGVNYTSGFGWLIPVVSEED